MTTRREQSRIDGPEAAFDSAGQLHSGFCQCHAPGRTLQQARADLPLELAHLQADRGLRAAELGRRPAERAMPRDSIESAQRLQIEIVWVKLCHDPFIPPPSAVRNRVLRMG